MWLVPSLVYWSSMGLIGYTYLGYPALTLALSRLRPRKVHREPLEPTVSLVMAAHNEAPRIATKLENLLQLDYPAEKLQVIAVSDGSSDGTDEVIRSFCDRGVLMERIPEPSGKPTAINCGLRRATGDIIVFCDARQQIASDAIRALVAPFADPQVGAVSGELHFPAERGPGMYWTYEKAIRAAESRIDSVVGATGALYAIRRDLFEPIPPSCLLDDVFTPMQIVLKGYRVLFEPTARVFDDEASLVGEFSRKARTLAGNYQLLEQLPGLLNPLKNRLALSFISHKLLRLVCPFALVGLLASNVWLVASLAPGWPLYVATLAGQLAGYGLALRGHLGGERCGRLVRLSHTFVTLNAAAVEGLRRYLKGDLGWTTAR